jgi:hypothetical protein
MSVRWCIKGSETVKREPTLSQTVLILENRREKLEQALASLTAQLEAVQIELNEVDTTLQSLRVAVQYVSKLTTDEIVNDVEAAIPESEHTSVASEVSKDVRPGIYGPIKGLLSQVLADPLPVTLEMAMERAFGPDWMKAEVTAFAIKGDLAERSPDGELVLNAKLLKRLHGPSQLIVDYINGRISDEDFKPSVKPFLDSLHLDNPERRKSVASTLSQLGFYVEPSDMG